MDQPETTDDRLQVSSLTMGVSFNAWAASAESLTFLDILCTAGVFASEVLSSGSVETMIKAEANLQYMSRARAQVLPG
jgi:hypothetical protein